MAAVCTTTRTQPSPAQCPAGKSNYCLKRSETLFTSAHLLDVLLADLLGAHLYCFSRKQSCLVSNCPAHLLNVLLANLLGAPLAGHGGSHVDQVGQLRAAVAAAEQRSGYRNTRVRGTGERASATLNSSQDQIKYKQPSRCALTWWRRTARACRCRRCGRGHAGAPAGGRGKQHSAVGPRRLVAGSGNRGPHTALLDWAARTRALQARAMASATPIPIQSSVLTFRISMRPL